jgi:hypothetical protein
MTTTAEIKTRSGASTVWLEVGYDGHRPPHDLFADLTMIGWRVPPTPPPPRAAIDWSTPDPATGERYTVQSWRVEGQQVDPPDGAGPRGAWLPAEAPAFLVALNGVLDRHGLTSRRAAAALATVTLVVEPEMRAHLDAQLAGLGLHPRWSATTVTRIQSYRGSPLEITAEAWRLDVVVAGGRARSVAEELAAVAGVDVDDPARVSIAAAELETPRLQLVDQPDAQTA